MLSAAFPAHPVPDGNVWFPHHFVIGAWGALFVSWARSSDGERPWLMVGGIMISLFGWYHVWPTGLPVTGALLVLIGLAVATIALRRSVWYDASDPKLTGLAALFLLIAWDDAFSHAFGVYTPLDRVWAVILSPLLI